VVVNFKVVGLAPGLRLNPGSFGLSFIFWGKTIASIVAVVRVNPFSRDEQGCQMVYFQTKAPKIWKKILEALGTETVDKLYGHFEYISAIWYVSWPFGNFRQFGIFLFPVLVYCV
jgi:hypothetical protein